MLETMCRDGRIELIELIELGEPWVAEGLLGKFFWILWSFTAQVEMVLMSDWSRVLLWCVSSTIIIISTISEEARTRRFELAGIARRCNEGVKRWVVRAQFVVGDK